MRGSGRKRNNDNVDIKAMLENPGDRQSKHFKSGVLQAGNEVGCIETSDTTDVKAFHELFPVSSEASSQTSPHFEYDAGASASASSSMTK
eukprot:4930057-Karenia_brevis.AAC.1